MKIARLVVGCVLCFSLSPCVGWTCFAQEDADEGLLEMVVDLLRNEDKEMRSVGLEQVRSQLKGQAATKRLVALLPELPPHAQVGLISALADRGDTAARPAIVALASADDGGACADGAVFSNDVPLAPASRR